MTTVYDMARALGKALLASEESLRLSDALAAEADERETESARSDYNNLINRVVGIILSEAAAEDPKDNSGKCSGCPGCGKRS